MANRNNGIQKCATTVAAALALTMFGAAPVFAQSAASSTAAAPEPIGVEAAARVTATVVGIDAISNSATVRGPRGNLMMVQINPEVGSVSKLQIGDTVNIAYRNALLIRADKVKSNGIRERIDTTVTTPASDGMTASAHSVQILATIQKLDVKHRTMTVRGATRTETFKVPDNISLKGLKVGDSVQAEFVSATAIQVERDGAPLK
ncbi:copper-binding protein [Paraburkholderia bonniea]|uniref:copper-binding protein n=1 Tax=Paraburkholderia bonniea TaxID=2152891 RepID=UPI0025737764|nr:copper-binding protein [Paraburkholderia bonniea]WJF90512.1 copper-binding protein [Paraburkholderia bonniea]WJF93827.1 copper-binding protein [Paraburkholderia bonniea]